MRAIKLHMALKSIKRFRAIVSIMARHGFNPFIEKMGLTRLISISERLSRRKESKKSEELSLPVKFRLAFEELGPTFIKFGQILSTRPDILPAEFIDELLKLQDEVPSMDFAQASEVIESEFDKPISELFKKIDEEPLAAASIAQVHRAITMEGDEVVVKIRRREIEKLIETDTSILRYIAGLLDRYIPESRSYDPVGMVDEFSSIIKKELDFTLEASHTERFLKNFADDKRVTIPKIYWDYTARTVLTMERINGIKVDNLDELKKKHIDPKHIAKLLADVLFKQVFEHRVFHGDLHSGNIFVLGKDRVAFVDFGIVGIIDKKMQDNLADLLIGLVKEDLESLTELFLEMGILPDDIDETTFKRDFWELTQHYFSRPFAHVKLGELMLEYITLTNKYQIRLPKDLLLFYKSLIVLEGLGKILNPEMNLIKEAEPYAIKLVKSRVGPKAVAKDGIDTAFAYADLLKNLPNYTNLILKKMIRDKIHFEVSHQGLDELLGEIDRSSNRLTFGVIVASLIIGSSLVTAFDAGPLVFGYSALGILGFIIATALGLWLAFQILRSGKY